MAGFVECLESEEAEEGAEKVAGKGQYRVTLLFVQMQQLPLSATNAKLKTVISLNDQS